MNFFRSIIWLLTFSFPVVALTQQFSFQTFSIEEGLGQSQVYSMIEDHQGYLWLGTQGGGINRFDGQHFDLFTTKDSLSDNFVNAICLYKNQELWIGTKAGLNIYNGHRFKNITHQEAPQGNINDLLADDQQQIWIGTNQGLFLFDGESFRNFSKERGLPPARIYCLHEQKNGTIWAGSTLGIWRIQDHQIDFFGEENFLPGRDVTAITEDAYRRVWIAIYGKGVYQFTGTDFKPLPSKEPLISTNIQTLAIMENDEIWIGTQNSGILIWTPKDSLLLQLDEQDGLSKNDVRSFHQDRWGDIWVGTSGGGLNKYAGQQFLHFDKEKGLLEEYVYALEEDSLGRIWFSEYDQGIAIFDGYSLQHIGRDSIPFPFISKSIFQNKQGHIWVGTEKNGLIIFEQDTIIYINESHGFPKSGIREIRQIDESEYLIATLGAGLLGIKLDTSYENGISINWINQQHSLSEDRILDIHVDSLDRVWYATRLSGVGCWSNKGVNYKFDQTDGLPSNAVRTLEADAMGNLWIGTANGIAKIKLYADSLYLYGQDNNQYLTYENVYLLHFDKNKHFWIGSQQGVEKATLDAEGNILATHFYGKNEGFLGIETCQNAVLEDEHGNLWFGTMNGLTKYVAGENVINQTPPVLAITDIRLFYESLEKTAYQASISDPSLSSNRLKFKPKDNHLGFRFQAVNLPSPEKVSYQWQLQGLESNWSPSSRQTEIMYPNLAAGVYSFRVKAANESGIWSNPVTVHFEVLPYFWETWWLQILSGLVFCATILFFFNRRTQQIKTKAKQERERLEMEKHLLELEQKALQLQMNPHFIFNALNTIQSQISDKDHQTARYQLAKFSKLMRSILENSLTSKISLAQEIETLKGYLALEQFSRNNSFTYHIEYDSNLEMDDIMIPSMMIQPFVENAIIHGVAHLNDGAGVITLKFVDMESYLFCTVTDNGIGRKAAKQLKSQLGEQHRSIALEVTRERLERLRHSDAKREALVIEDLKQKDGKAVGTKVSINIAL